MNGIVYANSVNNGNGASDDGVSLVRVIWVDTSGQHRCRVIPIKQFNDVVTKNGLGLALLIMGTTSALNSAAPETNLTAVGEVRLIPDLSTKRRIPWMKREEMVFCDMFIRPSEAWELCPREALRRVSKVLKDEFNLVMNAGFENEFVLLKSVLMEGKEEWVPIDSSPYGSTIAYDAVAPIFHEFLDALHSLNIVVEQLHPETGNGQFEIVLKYTTSLLSADNLIYAREAIRAISRKHGLIATFLPRYPLEGAPSGSHVHISLSQSGENVFMASSGSSKHGMSTVGEEFMAGVLHHLPSIMAITSPLPNSYDRIQPQTSAGSYQCWGKEHRQAALRTSCPPGILDDRVSNFEFRAFDGCANPYLGLAAIIAGGIDGLRKHLSLPEPIHINPTLLDTKLQRLPKSLSESLEALKKDTVLEDLLGEKLLTVIKGVRKAEIDYYSENKEAYKQLIHRY